LLVPRESEVRNNFPLVRVITYPGLNGRYFGTKGAEIQKTRLVPKLPKVNYKVASAVAEVNVVDLSVMFTTMQHEVEPSGKLEDCLAHAL
jgi:hypothetical protein